MIWGMREVFLNSTQIALTMVGGRFGKIKNLSLSREFRKLKGNSRNRRYLQNTYMTNTKHVYAKALNPEPLKKSDKSKRKRQITQ